MIKETVKAHPLVLAEPEPVIRVHELAASSFNFVCRPWSNTSDYWTVYWDLTHRMKEAFAEAGISIPYTQQDVHLSMHKRDRGRRAGTTGENRRSAGGQSWVPSCLIRCLSGCYLRCGVQI